MTLEELSLLLVNRGISGVPVVDGDRVVGVVSQQDLVASQADAARHQARALAPRRATGSRGFHGYGGDWPEVEQGLGCPDCPPHEAPEAPVTEARFVRDVMHPDVFTVDAAAPLEQVALEMVERQVRRLVVVDGDHFVGIVSSTDVLRWLATRAGLGERSEEAA